MGKRKGKRTRKAILRLADLEQPKTAVLNSLTSPSSRRSYDHAIREFTEWYCSEPRLAFNKTVVTRYRIFLEQAHYASSWPCSYAETCWFSGYTPRPRPLGLCGTAWVPTSAETRILRGTVKDPLP